MVKLPPIDCVTAIGDVADLRTWSGIPYSFWQASVRHGWEVSPVRLDMRAFAVRRRLWNLRHLIVSGKSGGYQYSLEFLRAAERQVESSLRARSVLSFHHHFPRARTVKGWGGRITYYLDATLAAELDGLALPLKLQHGQERALETERENLCGAERVITMARWLKEYLVVRYRIAPDKIQTVAPGANLSIPEGWKFVDRPAGTPFVLGLVGSDWKRKGLEFLLQVAGQMKRAGIDTRVRVLGAHPPSAEGLEAVGFVDKRNDSARFCSLVGSCDLGCLFSSHEAYGISLLEFLRLGVPVAGFLKEGMADTIPPDAGFGFPAEADVRQVSETFIHYARDRAAQEKMRAQARRWAPLLTWDRCVEELEAILQGETPAGQVQPWRGLQA